MRFIRRLTLPTSLCLALSGAFADDLTTSPTEPAQTSGDTAKLVQYLLNLGTWLGYNIQSPADSDISKVSSQLIDSNTAQVFETYLFYAVLGATPVNAISESLSAFAPDSMFTLNSRYANNTFQNYSSASGQQGAITINPLIDQPDPTAAKDPVSQSIANILGTPDYSYCLSSDNSTYTCGKGSDNNYLFQYKVAANVVGNIPNPYQFFSPDYFNTFLAQLNSNTLLSPLVYGNQSVSSQGSNKVGGLTAQSQAQVAQNFIRYVTGSVAPISLPSLSEYNNLYSQMISTDSSVSESSKVQAQATIANYLANLRVYAAQTSVAYSNLYFILSRRMPQNIAGAGASDSKSESSQALSEFNMATWRIFNQQSGNPDYNAQWINKINNASDATVQKEMAILLAEINYQIYLSRMQQERLLLTESVMLIQNSKAAQPNASLGSAASANSDTDSSDDDTSGS